MLNLLVIEKYKKLVGILYDVRARARGRVCVSVGFVGSVAIQKYYTISIELHKANRVQLKLVCVTYC